MRITTFAAATVAALLAGGAVTQTTHAGTAHQSHSSHSKHNSTHGSNGTNSSQNGAPGTDSIGGNGIGQGIGQGDGVNSGVNSQQGFMNLLFGGSSFQNLNFLQNVVP